MEIKEALEELGILFDTLYSTGCLTEEEAEFANEIERVITSYVKMKESDVKC